MEIGENRKKQATFDILRLDTKRDVTESKHLWIKASKYNTIQEELLSTLSQSQFSTTQRTRIEQRTLSNKQTNLISRDDFHF